MRGSIKCGTYVILARRTMHIGSARDVCDEPPMIFDIKKTGQVYECTGPGLGAKDSYGDGPIYVSCIEDLIIFEEGK